ncbi:GPW/gp25 family protein [Pseudoflavitalea sp. G-6-1-2]|uniref:GPW/gp25 family protein n=1 Tax=Pseudoflavitalea sp. G-6-1-2 TaxID=2728841 RepID=UPI00146F436A|nr:GPW/gp25 family protein [Pseudoflavitalea sp. G-6-1-2]NML21660.1 GPW/gp25 family protein [Pseudoflavitalea sp. G-6-1-2]
MNDNLFNSFLGTGWAFPPEFSIEAGSVEMVSAVQDINQSLNILLSTSLGERVMQPKYGCNLQDYLFEPMNATIRGYIKELVTNAILYYEPRIIADKIEITAADSFDLIEGRFTILVEYTIPGTNSRFNYVYDYYLNEALKTI